MRCVTCSRASRWPPRSPTAPASPSTACSPSPRVNRASNRAVLHISRWVRNLTSGRFAGGGALEVRAMAPVLKSDAPQVASVPRVLVIEDDPSTASFLQRALRQEAYQVELATDGVAGLAAA